MGLFEIILLLNMEFYEECRKQGVPEEWREWLL